MVIISNVIWIEPNINSKENINYLKELLSFHYLKIRSFTNVEEAINLIKSIRFEETNIIINISLFKQFIDKFKENIKDIYVIPKIIIFSKNKNKLINEKINNSFYNLGGIKTSFDEIIQFIINPVKIKRNLEEENQLTFEYIDCKEKLVLPMFFKSMIELTPKDNIDNFTELIYNKYSKMRMFMNY